MSTMTYTELKSKVSLELLPGITVIDKETGRNILRTKNQECFAIIDGAKFCVSQIVNSFVNRTELRNDRHIDQSTHLCNLEVAYYNLENQNGGN